MNAAFVERALSLSNHDTSVKHFHIYIIIICNEESMIEKEGRFLIVFFYFCRR